jgi:hypothetical protein
MATISASSTLWLWQWRLAWGWLMVALVMIPLPCWLYAWLARPGRPIAGCEVQELVYSRLLGRQQRLALLALMVTGMMLLSLVAMLPQRIDATLQAVRGAHADCSDSVTECYELQAGGVWIRQTRQADGSWQPIATVAAPIALDATIHGRKP